MADQKITAQIEADSKKAKQETASLKEEIVGLRGEVGNLAGAVDKLGNSYGKHNKSALLTRANIGLTIGNLKKTMSILKKVTDYTGNYSTSVKLLNTTLGSGSKEADKYVKKLAEISGIDEATLNRQVALFGQLGQSLNMGNQYAEKFSKNLTTLATKMSILYNSDFGSMATSLQRAVQGTQTTLKSKTGIQVTQQGMQDLLASRGINVNVSSLNEAEKALVKYAVILERVTQDNAIYANSVNSVAWQKQMLTMQVTRLATAIGNALYPVLQKILPVLNGIVMAITEIVNLIAKLVGFSVDTSGAVGDLSEEFEDLGTGITSASNAVKKSLRSFDKLNNITTPSKGGAGAGTGLSIDPKISGLLDDMNDNFLKIKNHATEIRDKILDWLGFTRDENNELKWTRDKFLKNLIEGWNKLDTLGKIFVELGIVLILSKMYSWIKKILGLSIVKKVKDIIGATDTMFKSYGKHSKDVLDTTQRWSLALGGVLEIIGGLTIFSDSLKSIKENGANVANVLGTISGILLTILGTTSLVVAVFGTLNIVSGGLGIALGALVVAITGVITWLNSEKTATDEVINSKIEFKKKIEELKKAQEESIASTMAQANRAENLKDRLLELVDANGKVIGSEEEVQKILHTLNDILGTNYKLEGDRITQDGKRIKTNEELKKSIDNYCQSLRVEAQLEAYKEEYIARAKRQLELQRQIEEKTKDLEEAQKDYNLTTTEGVMQFITDNKDLIRQLADLQQQYENNEQELDRYESSAYEASIGHYNEAQKLLSETLVKIGITSQDVIKDVINTSEKIPDEIKKNINKIGQQMPTVTIPVQLNTNSLSKQLTSVRNSMAQSGINMPSVSLKADGGFVKEGELFIAREAGAEMVGSINGHTAVANNDQIVSGIKQGVFSAMMSALSTQDFSSKVVIEASGDDTGLMNFINFKQKQLERQFN